jgi:hypothetical protein
MTSIWSQKPPPKESLEPSHRSHSNDNISISSIQPTTATEEIKSLLQGVGGWLVDSLQQIVWVVISQFVVWEYGLVWSGGQWLAGQLMSLTSPLFPTVLKYRSLVRDYYYDNWDNVYAEYAEPWIFLVVNQVHYVSYYTVMFIEDNAILDGFPMNLFQSAEGLISSQVWLVRLCGSHTHTVSLLFIAIVVITLVVKLRNVVFGVLCAVIAVMVLPSVLLLFVVLKILSFLVSLITRRRK